MTLMGFRRVWLLLMALAGAFALIAAGCGNDDDDTPTQPAEEAPAPAEPADEEEAPAPEPMDPVTIAFISEETGPSAIPLHSVMDATIGAINAEGGFNGHPVEVRKYDSAGVVAEAQAAVSDFPDDIIAVFLNTSTTESSIADSLSALGVPILGVGYSPPVWSGVVTPFGLSCEVDPEGFCANENFFTTTTTFDAVVAQQLVVAQINGATHATSASCVEVDSCAAADPVFQAVAAGIGLQSSPTVRVSTTAPDYTSECIGFIQQGVDFIQLSMSDFAGVTLMESCLDQGYDGWFGASAGSVSSALLNAPGRLNGGLNGFPWFINHPLVNAYRDIMESAGVPEDDWGHSHATSTYTALRLLQKAIADHADPSAPLDGAAALTAMYSLDGETLDGLLSQPVSYSPDDLDRVVACFWPYITDGAGNFDTPLGDLNTACYPE